MERRLNDMMITESLKEVKSLLKESLKAQSDNMIAIAEIKTKMDMIHARGCQSGVSMHDKAINAVKTGDTEIHRRIDRQRNITGAGALIAGAVTAIVAWMKH